MSYKEPITGRKLEDLEKKIYSMDRFSKEVNNELINEIFVLIFRTLQDLDVRSPRFMRARGQESKGSADK